MPLRAVIFDLDCTLTCRRSTMTATARMLSELYADYLHPECLPALEASLHSADNFGYRDRREFFQDIFTAECWKKQPDVDELLHWWTHRFGECQVLHGEVMPLLQELRRRALKLGIITNGSAVTQSSKLKMLGIVPLFDHVIISGEFGVSKPDPSIFRHSVESLGVRVGEAVYVGDHAHNDILGAESAGLRAVWITTGGPWPQDLPPPDRQIKSLAELPSILDTLA